MKKIKIRIFAVHAKIWDRAQYGASLQFAVLRSRKTGERTGEGNPADTAGASGTVVGSSTASGASGAEQLSSRHRSEAVHLSLSSPRLLLTTATLLLSCARAGLKLTRLKTHCCSKVVVESAPIPLMMAN